MRVVISEKGAHWDMAKQELEGRAGHAAHSVGIWEAVGLLLSTREGVARNEGGIKKIKEGK